MAEAERKRALKILQEAQTAIDYGAARRRLRDVRHDVKQGEHMAGRPAEPVGVGQYGGVSPSETPLMDPDEQWIIQRESSGKTTAKNPKSSAFGLGQLIKSNREHYGKLLGVDPNTTDFGEQLQMFRQYVKSRYGSAAEAKKFWEQHGWY